MGSRGVKKIKDDLNARSINRFVAPINSDNFVVADDGKPFVASFTAGNVLDSTVLVHNCDGTNGVTSGNTDALQDATAQYWTGGELDTSEKKFGTASMALDGTTCEVQNSVASIDRDDVTFDFFIKLDGTDITEVGLLSFDSGRIEVSADIPNSKIRVILDWDEYDIGGDYSEYTAPVTWDSSWHHFRIALSGIGASGCAIGKDSAALSVTDVATSAIGTGPYTGYINFGWGDFDAMHGHLDCWAVHAEALSSTYTEPSASYSGDAKALEKTDEITAKQVDAGSGNDLDLILGDASGVKKLNIKDSSGNIVATIDSGGSMTVGDSTTSDATLEVANSTTKALRISNGNNRAYYYEFERDNASTGNFYLGGAAGGAKTNYWTFATNGAFGVGTSAPQANTLFDCQGVAAFKSYTTGTLPTAVGGGHIYVSDATGKPTEYYSDGTNWYPIASRGTQGGIYIKSGSTAQTSIGTSPVKMTGFAGDLASDGVTPAYASNQITVDETGTYNVDFDCSFSGSLSTTFDFFLYVDGSPASSGALQRKIGTGGDVGNSSFSTEIALTATDVLTIYVQADGASKTITPVHSHFHIKRTA